jgi:FlaA1/EpsC-like NDP-sugar epimerase
MCEFKHLKVMMITLKLTNNQFLGIMKQSKVQEFYNGKTIFITGASGFMGKVRLNI